MSISTAQRRLLHVGLALSLPALSLAGCGGSPLSSAVTALPPGTVTTESVAPANTEPEPVDDVAGAPAPATEQIGPTKSEAERPAQVTEVAPVSSSSSTSSSGSRSSGGSSSSSASAPAPEAATAGDSVAPLPEAPPVPTDETPTMTAMALPPNTTPMLNLGGMNAAASVPTVRSTFFDVSPDGRRVAIAWLHNQPKADGSFDVNGEPTTWAIMGDPATPSSFTKAKVISRRMFDYAAGADSFKKYNLAHNAPFVLADRKGGFVSLSLPMNANGYAQNMAATTFGYALNTMGAAYSTFSAQGKAMLANLADGSSLSEMTGNMDPAGNAHIFGQGHRGQFQSGFGYQRLKAGATTWEGKTLGAAYRASGLNYFCEGGGYAAQVKNSKGFYDIHAAFTWNKAGITPFYGLSYVVSHDGGSTWQTAAGSTLSLPVKHSDTAAAVFPANLYSTAAGGAVPGHSTVVMGAADDGTPMIIRPNFTDSARQAVQHTLYAYTGGKWITVKVGPALFWNTAGSGIAYNGVTGKVNVVLLDTGSYSKPARVLLYSQSLADLKAGKSVWKEEVIATLKQTHYAADLKVREVKNTKFVCLFDGEYRNPGTVQPVLVEAPMR